MLSGPRRRCRLRFWAALGSSAAAAIVFIALWVLLFSVLPATDGSGLMGLPHAPWKGRFDLAQFFGTLLDPPYPTGITWIVGIASLLAVLTASGIGYCTLLAWGMRPAQTGTSLGFGLGLYLTIGISVWLAPGFQPAVMRGAIPDTGFFLLGWSGWASMALLAVCLAYGLCLGCLYRRTA